MARGNTAKQIHEVPAWKSPSSEKEPTCCPVCAGAVGRRDAMTDLKLSEKVRLGEKRADKFLAEVEKRRQLTLIEFFGSRGIFGLGKRRATLIQEAVPGELDSLEDWFSGKLITVAQQASPPRWSVFHPGRRARLPATSNESYVGDGAIGECRSTCRRMAMYRASRPRRNSQHVWLKGSSAPMVPDRNGRENPLFAPPTWRFEQSG